MRGSRREAMGTVTIRFHGDLNEFLPYRRRDRAFAVRVQGSPAAKAVIESLGVPHPEVDAIVSNGRSVDFGNAVRAGDNIEVYAVGAVVDVSPVLHLAPEPPAPRFVLDVHLGRLAAYLRMLGFDTLYESERDDDVLARIAHDEERILLTRDLGLLKRGAVVCGHYVRETAPERQAAEVLRRYGLLDVVMPFTRCLSCNGSLAPVAPKSAVVLAQAPERVRQHHTEFERCADCGKVFWKGTHYVLMRDLIARLRGEE